MTLREVTLASQADLRAENACHLFEKAKQYKSDIYIEKDARRISGKSLLSILSLGIWGETTIRIIADGIDEKEAVAELKEFIENL